MPHFQFTKSSDLGMTGDTTVSVAVQSDNVQQVREAFEDFLAGAGFVLPEPDFERRLTQEDYVAKEEDYMWDDAVNAKFNGNTINLDKFDLGGK